MSLEALGLAGIRSYSPQSLEKLEFFSPLTLIWGKNGSGKTTIIEALKYITTGGFPPESNKGKKFIMDPKIAGSSEVRGEIRLKFKAFTGRPIMAKKKMMAQISSSTANGLKFQSTEQLLQTKDDKGQLITINHQCAEMEKQIPEFLGISKAILQNIVFCHQEDSLWPFADSNTLKNIFDQLFQTKRFTKTMDAIWVKKLEYMKKQKQLKAQISYVKDVYIRDTEAKQKSLKILADMATKSKELEFSNKKLSILEKETTNSIQDKKKNTILILAKGSHQQKIKGYDLEVQKLKKQLNFLNEKTPKQRLVLTLIDSQEQANKKLQEIKANKEEISNKKASALDELENIKFSKQTDHIEIEIKTQIKRLKDFHPDFKRISNMNEVDIISKLHEICKSMEEKKIILRDSKDEMQKIQIPVLFEVAFTEQEYLANKKCCENEQIELNKLKTYLITCSRVLIKKVDRSKLQYRATEGIEQKLNDHRAQQNMKTQELRHYEGLPAQQSIRDQMIKIKYGGIQLYQTLCKMCKQKGKCHFCKKNIQKDELEQIQKEAQKIKKKAEKKLHELEFENQTRVDIDPALMVKKLRQELEKGESVEKQLVHNYNNYQMYRNEAQQLKKNQLIESTLKKLNILFTGESNSAYQNGNNSSFEYNLQIFKQKAQNYEKKITTLSLMKKQLNNYEERSKKNKELLKQKQKNEKKRQQLLNTINENEEQTKDYEILNQFLLRLKALLKSKKKKSKKEGNQSENNTSKENDSFNKPEDLIEMIKSYDYELSKLQMDRNYIQILKQYRFFMEETQTSTKQIQKLNKQLNELNDYLEGKEEKIADYNKLKIQSERLKQEIQLKTQMALVELNKPNSLKYQKILAEINMNEMIIKELDQEYRMIESSINKYHKEKMEEVNHMIYEVWRSISHEGGDIDFIEIQTSSEVDEANRKKKNYNYSIVMGKCGVNNKPLQKPIDMKGRCSMGQKVLASIVIRLALSEAFSAHSKLLALDEPTTNLDQEHSSKLALQLNKLIESRENQDLQLIIISHDLGFIKKLEKYSEFFYQVSKNQHKFSTITKKELREMYNDHQ